MSFRRTRPRIITVGHYCALVGMYLLMTAIFGAVYVVSSVLAWVVIPLIVLDSGRRLGA